MFANEIVRSGLLVPGCHSLQLRDLSSFRPVSDLMGERERDSIAQKSPTQSEKYIFKK